MGRALFDFGTKKSSSAVGPRTIVVPGAWQPQTQLNPLICTFHFVHHGCCRDITTSILKSLRIFIMAQLGCPPRRLITLARPSPWAYPRQIYNHGTKGARRAASSATSATSRPSSARQPSSRQLWATAFALCLAAPLAYQLVVKQSLSDSKNFA